MYAIDFHQKSKQKFALKPCLFIYILDLIFEMYEKFRNQSVARTHLNQLKIFCAYCIKPSFASISSVEYFTIIIIIVKMHDEANAMKILQKMHIESN